jgi:hypothetical protein
MYIRQPFGTFDFTGNQIKFLPAPPYFPAAARRATFVSRSATLPGRLRSKAGLRASILNEAVLRFIFEVHF